MADHLFDYTLQLADTSLILAHRLSEWCGHGPVLEQDLAMANISLDLLGQARSYYQYAAELEGKGRSEDDLAYLRSAVEYKNPLLVEQPNGDFAHTVVRQFLFDTYHVELLEGLALCPDERLQSIAIKSLKEATYHRQWSSEWVIRLGDSTAVARMRVEEAIYDLWPYQGELTAATPIENGLISSGFLPAYSTIALAAEAFRRDVLERATLPYPEGVYQQMGGKAGRHSEHLRYLLSELQYMQRAYPGMEW